MVPATLASAANDAITELSEPPEIVVAPEEQYASHGTFRGSFAGPRSHQNPGGADERCRRLSKALAGAGFAGKPFATFSTGGTVFDEQPNTQASEKLYEIMSVGGMGPLAPPFMAGIEGYKPPGIVKGPLPESEVARAKEFGHDLGARLAGD